MIMEYGIILCGIVFLLLVISSATKTKTPDRIGAESRLARIEAKLDLLLKDAGIEYDPYKDVPPEITARSTGARRSWRSSSTETSRAWG